MITNLGDEVSWKQEVGLWGSGGEGEAGACAVGGGQGVKTEGSGQ